MSEQPPDQWALKELLQRSILENPSQQLAGFEHEHFPWFTGAHPARHSSPHSGGAVELLSPPAYRC